MSQPEAEQPAELDADAMLERLIALCRERKAADIVELDVRGLVDYMDAMLIVTGLSLRQNRAIAQHVITEMKRQHRILALSRAGIEAGNWICLDYVDVVLHIFDEEHRAHYDLELLWADAERTEHAPAEPAQPVDL